MQIKVKKKKQTNNLLSVLLIAKEGVISLPRNQELRKQFFFHKLQLIPSLSTGVHYTVEQKNSAMDICSWLCHFLATTASSTPICLPVP